MNSQKKHLRQTVHPIGSQEIQETLVSAKALDFATPEALLQFDRSITTTPVALRRRIVATLSQTPKSNSIPWWKRLF
jgi:hypothetical protein